MMIGRICIIIVLTSAVYGSEILWENRTFCEDRVRDILQQFCEVYYSPSDVRPNRDVIAECCHNPCSAHYFLSCYCKSFNKEGVIRFMEEERRQKLIKRIQEMDSKRNGRKRRES